MQNSIYINFLELQDEIKTQFQGGIDGLEILFDKYLNKLKANNFKLSHTNFEDFYSGKDIEVLGFHDKSFQENNGKVKNISIRDFYETNFLFEYEPTSFDVFNNPNNLLQETLNKIKKIVLSEQFDKEQKTLFLNELIIHINQQITISENDNKFNNNILHDKLKYLSNGYKATIDFINNLYNKSFNLTENTNLSSTIIKKDKISDWHLVFPEILNGNIQVEKINNYKTKFIYLSKEFKNPTGLGNYLAKVLNKNESSIRTIITSTINGGAQKDIFTKENLDKINSFISKYDNNMCPYFQERYNKLI